MRTSIQTLICLLLALSMTARFASALDHPSGLAGRARTIPAVEHHPGGTGQYFEWYQYFDIHRFASGGEVAVEIALIPFQGRGATHLGLDAEGGTTFLSLRFRDGLVNEGLPYHPAAWNSVRVLMDFGAQSYRLSVNGAEAGPFSFNRPSQSVQAFRVNYESPGTDTAIAWFDSLAVATPSQTLLRIDFDTVRVKSPSLCQGCTITALDPSQPDSPPAIPETLTILTQPRSQEARLGQGVKLEVLAAGPPPLLYQWTFNGIPIPGATSPALNLTGMNPSAQGLYRVTVTDGRGQTVQSEGAVLSLFPVGGTVHFSNRVPPEVDAPVFAENGSTALEGDRYWAQLYAGPTPGDLNPIGPAVPFRTGLAAGYWDPSPNAVRAIPAVRPGDPASVQIRVWDGASGATFDEAVERGGLAGQSTVLQIATGGSGSPPSLPPPLTGLSSFQLRRAASGQAEVAIAAPLGPFVAPPVMGLVFSGGQIRVNVSGELPERFEIQTSSDLIEWSVTGFIPTDGDLILEAPRGSSHQFYRLRSLAR